jgi:hypothetical protein
MDGFFGSNPGMGSRIAHHLDFAAYELDELTAIGRLMLERSRYYLSEDAEAALREYLTRQMQEPRFANARSVRNELERARLRHAHRLASDLRRHWTRDDLMRLEPVDILTDSAGLLVEDNRARLSRFIRSAPIGAAGDWEVIVRHRGWREGTGNEGPARSRTAGNDHWRRGNGCTH